MNQKIWAGFRKKDQAGIQSHRPCDLSSATQPFLQTAVLGLQGRTDRMPRQRPQTSSILPRKYSKLLSGTQHRTHMSDLYYGWPSLLERCFLPLG